MSDTFSIEYDGLSYVIARGLLQIGAVELRPSQPFTWSSGWRSPIYCDNRLLLGYPVLRNAVVTGFEAIIENELPAVELIAGAATGGIPHAAMLADRMGLPCAYVRSEPKAHGRGKQIEGYARPGMKAVVIEDTLSTGKSAYNAAQALRDAGVDVISILTILSYDFDIASEKAIETGIPAYRLVPYEVLLQVALERGDIEESDIALLMKWRKSPDTFGV
ncbi:orotate phosphoribosyltransferase [Alicyclobacillus hesperidum URH17-3-68]|uniref:Orotate phosphoribosyltransferase n=1 Tax=Alicyclobacillus hesperidum TaxID=89784 RepID=A0A1H2UX36_9BACL|nr:orotate phosphoribosyltransferase [Alicyclobacillus hesperidum]EJY55828.1 orotate phosphoribosyltransferase [Alicyclobacillus hesperidum URH17-3-68]GLV14600.1 orotate phosphoribosyltransferase [Alicyclobacillus hesperidum]SDW60670.1 orotate phosphoribosyltransferase [Alicyclobacillus hesperidum]